MSEIILCDAIREKLADVLKDIYHPTDDSRGRTQEFKAPEIYDGFMPPKNSDEIPDFPCVIVRPSEGDTQMRDGNRPQETVSIKLLIGSYGRDNSDYQYCLVIWRRIINHFRQFPVLKYKYRMTPMVKWRIPDEQARDIWYLEAVMIWEVPTVQEYLEEDGFNVHEE